MASVTMLKVVVAVLVGLVPKNITTRYHFDVDEIREMDHLRGLRKILYNNAQYRVLL